MVVIEIESGDVSLFNATDHVGSTERLKDLISDLRPSEVYAVTRYVLVPPPHLRSLLAIK